MIDVKVFKENAIDTSKWSDEKRRDEIKIIEKKIDNYVYYINDYRRYEQAKRDNMEYRRTIEIIRSKGIIPPIVDIVKMENFLYKTLENIRDNFNNCDIVKQEVYNLLNLGFKTVKKDERLIEYRAEFRNAKFGVEIYRDGKKMRFFKLLDSIF